MKIRRILPMGFVNAVRLVHNITGARAVPTTNDPPTPPTTMMTVVTGVNVSPCQTLAKLDRPNSGQIFNRVSAVTHTPEIAMKDHFHIHARVSIVITVVQMITKL